MSTVGVVVQLGPQCRRWHVRGPGSQVSTTDVILRALLLLQEQSPTLPRFPSIICRGPRRGKAAVTGHLFQGQRGLAGG